MTWEYSVQVSATIQTNPPAIRFSWPQDMATLPDFYTVCRKAPTAEDWGKPTVLPGTATNYLDTNVTIGVRYEYRFYKSTSNHLGYGYICAGIDLPLVENRGKIVLLVDQTFATTLADQLARLQQDLVGDGWLVLRHDIARNASVPDVRAIIKADYDADPANVKALFLLGRIPVPYAGDLAPDGHGDDGHRGAWPADTFYGDMDGVWTDTKVTDISAYDPRNRNVPGDGKYDQSEIPGHVALEIGRVDLANMPGLNTNLVPTFPSEGQLLLRYLNKDHNYRHKLVSVPARGLVYNRSGDRGGEAFAADAWRNYAPLLGPPPAQPLGINEFLPILRTNGYQWAYATDGASPTQMWNLGGNNVWLPYSTATGSTVDFVQMDIHTVFTMLLGSWLGDWDWPDNLMRAVLATPTYGLACVYAGRPHWFFHYMGIGETLGYCARLTQNNHTNGLYQLQTNNFEGGVHIELLGDPTLRLHPIAPPSALQAVYGQPGVRLSWAPSIESVVGYHVYRAANAAGPFVRLTEAPIPATSYLDSSGLSGNATYMVRGVKLQTTPSGSYFDASQGVFASVNSPLTLSLSPSGTATLAWHSSPPQVFRVFWTDSLANTNWTPLDQELFATDSTVACSISPSGDVSGSGWVFTNIMPQANFTWVDDSLPQGAVLGVGSDPWNWVTNNPAPYSGSAAIQSAAGVGLHQQYFSEATAPMVLASGDVLVAYVYLDPEDLPSEIMLQWYDGQSWEHRAFWGDDLIWFGVAGTPGHVYKGLLPAPGNWFRLQVLPREVALEGATVSGLALGLWNGRATWDYIGKYANLGPYMGPLTDNPNTTNPAQRFFKVQALPSSP